MLKTMHKGLEHKGKVPARLLKARQREAEIRKLQRELRRAVDDEKYEAAAEIRDRIKKIETEAEAR
jgi:protein arginine kinase activator